MKCYTSWPRLGNVVNRQNFFIVNEQSVPDPAYLSTLEHQKDLLEINLANCVTYLQALRKKHAQNALQLDSALYLPRKKKKRIQQNMRQLDKEIKYRERDEEAFLNNLQACKTNIYLAEAMSSPRTPVSSTVPDLASDFTFSPHPEDSEPTESSWCGWMVGNTAHPPLQRNASNPPLVNDLTPDDHLSIDEISKKTKTADFLHDTKCVEHANATWTLPVTSAPTQFTFRPEAAVFEPQTIFKE